MTKRAVTAARFIEKWIKDLNHHKSLVDYNASKYILPFLEDRGIYMEVPFRNKIVLGHSLIDDLGASTMINKNIPTLERKVFTQAHELGHHILDPDLLRNNSEINILTDDPIELNKSAEVRANAFAAHILLPDDVLNASMLEGRSKKQMKMKQCISYETLSYRLITFLTNVFCLPKDLAVKMVSDFMDYDKSDSLYVFWQKAYTKKPVNEQRSLRTINKEIALGQDDYDFNHLRTWKYRRNEEYEKLFVTMQERLMYFSTSESEYKNFYDQRFKF